MIEQRIEREKALKAAAKRPNTGKAIYLAPGRTTSMDFLTKKSNELETEFTELKDVVIVTVRTLEQGEIKEKFLRYKKVNNKLVAL